MKILDSKNIKKFTLTLLNIIKIFLISFVKSHKEKSSRFVFFYFPVRAYQENIVGLANMLDKDSNIYVYLIYNSFTAEDLKSKKNSLFIDLNYLRFVPFSNFFLSKINLLISSYVIYTFLPNTKNIYISHDIYDTPMVNKEIEKNHFIFLSKLDYIFVSSDIVKQYFENSFREYIKSRKIKKKAKIINTGYLKLDYVSNKLKKNSNVKFLILIAPTASNHYKKINLSSHLFKMIQFLIKNNYKIIYRPHPMDLTKKGNNLLTQNIIEKFKNFTNFTFDTSTSYLDSYLKSDVLLTDFSGTAYTYAFSKEKPVIFYSNNKDHKLMNDLKSLYYFKDRNKVGYVVDNFNDLNKKLKKIKRNSNILKVQIKNIRKERIEHFGNSLNITKKQIENLL
jgi:CDP-glycerol glycerophosphotransferase (TagB/SpsB family)